MTTATGLSLRIAAKNIEDILRGEDSSAGGSGLFAEDLRLAADLTGQLEHDSVFLTSALDRTENALAAARLLGRTSGA